MYKPAPASARHPKVVGVVERAGGAVGDEQSKLELHPLTLVGEPTEQRVQVHAADILHHQVKDAVDVTTLQCLHDVGVVEETGDVRLHNEVVEEEWVLRLLDEQALEHHDRRIVDTAAARSPERSDLAALDRLLESSRSKDLRHPAEADSAEEVVVPENLHTWPRVRPSCRLARSVSGSENSERIVLLTTTIG